jgi:hypothetical protein
MELCVITRAAGSVAAPPYPEPRLTSQTVQKSATTIDAVGDQLDAAKDRCELSIYHLAQQAGKLEELAKERLRQQAKNDGTLLRYQLVKFGVCPCTCHTSSLVHASRPCCVQARLQKTLADEEY